uniref:Putative ovule protein n=1 Tax=Solanum chacoense TaxID=4108 RepID=A0A0V0HWD1_SOLCH
MQPYQIRHSRLNGAVEIYIRGHFDKKWVPLPKVIFKSKPTKGLGKISKTSRHKRKVNLDQTRHSGANHADGILIRARLLKMLTKVNLKSNFKG